MTAKLNDKNRVVFDSCDGRSSICSVDFSTKEKQQKCRRQRDRNPDHPCFLPYPNITRCNQCPEYASNYEEALSLLRQWLLQHKERIMKEEGERENELLGFAEFFVSNFKQIKENIK
jgi:hypothetical protein